MSDEGLRDARGDEQTILEPGDVLPMGRGRVLQNIGPGRVYVNCGKPWEPMVAAKPGDDARLFEFEGWS